MSRFQPYPSQRSYSCQPFATVQVVNIGWPGVHPETEKDKRDIEKLLVTWRKRWRAADMVNSSSSNNNNNNNHISTAQWTGKLWGFKILRYVEHIWSNPCNLRCHVASHCRCMEHLEESKQRTQHDNPTQECLSVRVRIYLSWYLVLVAYEPKFIFLVSDQSKGSLV